MTDLVFKGPLNLQPGEVACAECRDWIRHGEPVFLVEDADPRDDVYVHLVCARAYLEREEV